MTTRRIFLQTSMAAAMASPYAAAQEAPAGRKTRIAGIGVGGMGLNNMTNLAGEDIVALCDVDQRHAAGAFKKFPDAKRWRNFREMLEKQPEIEAVMIATPDHTHTSIALAALKGGKHVYCQKPLTHDIHKARLLPAAAKESRGCVAVMGNQHHSSAGMRKIADWVRGGVIGEVKRVIAWCSLNYRRFGNAYWSALTELTHLGNLAIKLGGRIEWDAGKCLTTNRPEAASLIRRPRRAGWELE